MTHSMTGFARAQETGDWGELTCEIRSVNHRYLDLQFRLPEELRALEPDFRQRATAVLGRGKVECTLRLRMAASAAALQIDSARLTALAAVCAQAGAVLPASAPIDPLRALAWPGVVLESPPDTRILRLAAGAALDAALAEVCVVRADEGARLAALLRERAGQVQALVGEVRARLPRVRDAWLARLRTRLAELAVAADPGRVEQELALLAQRMDVDEELARIASHVEAFEQTLEQTEPVGRRMDFLMQEFNREANTLASKSQDAEVTRCAVELKVLIEQMREQVQNIE